MLKFINHSVYLFIILITFGQQINGENKTKPISNPLNGLLNKFQQNDYKIAYEWSEVVNVDKTHVEYYKNCFKYNRTTTAVNVTLFPKFYAGYDVEIVLQAYRFASNEYRLYPIRFQFNLCEGIEKRTMGFDKIAINGNITCPILKGKYYHYYNWTPEGTRFPPLIPTGKYMLELQFMYHSKELLKTREYGSVYRPLAYEK